MGQSHGRRSDRTKQSSGGIARRPDHLRIRQSLLSTQALKSHCSSSHFKESLERLIFLHMKKSQEYIEMPLCFYSYKLQANQREAKKRIIKAHSFYSRQSLTSSRMNSSRRLRVPLERSCTNTCRSSSIVERPHLEETMQVQPLPSAWIIPSEPITRSEGQDMAERDAHLTSATIKKGATNNNETTQ